MSLIVTTSPLLTVPADPVYEPAPILYCPPEMLIAEPVLMPATVTVAVESVESSAPVTGVKLKASGVESMTGANEVR